MRKLWLLFAQAVTATLAVLFVLSLVKPDWLPWRTQVVEVRESTVAAASVPVALNPRAFSDCPNVIGVRPVAAMRTTARSVSVSVPTTLPVVTRPSASVTWISATPSTTWSLVRM